MLGTCVLVLLVGSHSHRCKAQITYLLFRGKPEVSSWREHWWVVSTVVYISYTPTRRNTENFAGKAGLLIDIGIQCPEIPHEDEESLISC